MRFSLYALFAIATALVWVALKVIDLLRWLAAGVVSSSAQQRMAAGQYRQALSLYRLARRLTIWLRRARGQAALGEGLAHLALWQPAAAEQALSLARVSHFKAAQSTDPEFAASVLGARALAAALLGRGDAFRGFEQRTELPGRKWATLELARAVQACREQRWADAGPLLAALPPEGAVNPPGLAPALRTWCAAHAGAAPVAMQCGALGAGAAPEDVRRVWPELVQFVERKPAAAA
jgi:hypothetical protein